MYFPSTFVETWLISFEKSLICATMAAQLASQSDEAQPQVLETDEQAITQSPPFKGTPDDALLQLENKVDTALNLQDLSFEILLQIFECILDGQTWGLATLKQLRMVSKRIAAIASKPLFKTVKLDTSLHLWNSLQYLAQHTVLAHHVRVLVLSIGPSFEPQPGTFDLSLLANLQEIEHTSGITPALVLWRVRRELGYSRKYPKNIQPLLPHIIPIGLFDNYFIYRLQRLISFGFHIQYLSIHFFAWQNIWERQVLSISLQKLEVLHLWPSEQDDEKLLTLVQAIKDLPALITFKIFNQARYTSSTSGEMDLLRNLGENKNWPRLRHLELFWPVRTVADLEAFLSPHIGHGLKTLILHGLCLVIGWQSMEATFVERQEAPVIVTSSQDPCGVFMQGTIKCVFT